MAIALGAAGRCPPQPLGRAVACLESLPGPPFLAVLHAVAVAADVNDVAVVQKAVDERKRPSSRRRQAHFLEHLFDVSTVDARSWRALISWKKSAPPLQPTLTRP